MMERAIRFPDCPQKIVLTPKVVEIGFTYGREELKPVLRI